MPLARSIYTDGPGPSARSERARPAGDDARIGCPNAGVSQRDDYACNPAFPRTTHTESVPVVSKCPGGRGLSFYTLYKHSDVVRHGLREQPLVSGGA